MDRSEYFSSYKPLCPTRRSRVFTMELFAIFAFRVFFFWNGEWVGPVTFWSTVVLVSFWLLMLLQMHEEMTMTYQASSSSSLAAAPANVCYRYAIVRDVTAHTDIDVCSSAERISHAYTSVGNSLEIRLFRQRVSINHSSAYNSPSTAGPFLLHYTGIMLYSYTRSQFQWVSK